MTASRLAATRDRLGSGVAAVRRRVDSYPPALSAAFVFLPLLLVYLATATYDSDLSPDPVAAAVPAWQYATHGNFTLDAFENMTVWFVESGDRIVSNRTPGVIFFAIPFYWLLAAPNEPNILPSAVAAATACAAAMATLHLVFRQLTSPSLALLGAFVAGLATSTWSVSADAMWGHGPNQLWLGLALLGLAVERYTASGIGFGLAVFTRPQLAVIPAVTGIWAGVRKRSFLPIALVGVPAAAGLAGLVLYNRVMFQATSVRGGYGGYVTDNLANRPLWDYAEGIAGTLVSPDRGLLVMSPFLLALLPGLRAAWRAAPTWVRSAAVAGAVYMLVQLRINYFSGGNNFYSYRLSIELLTMAAPLLLLAYREWTSRTALRRRVLSALVFLSIALQGLGAIYHHVDYVERGAWTAFKAWDAAQIAGWPVLTAFVLLGVLHQVLFPVTGRPATLQEEARHR